jgi:hypothetical protein
MTHQAFQVFVAIFLGSSGLHLNYELETVAKFFGRKQDSQFDAFSRL